jgi:protein-disulfide isomerase
LWYHPSHMDEQTTGATQAGGMNQYLVPASVVIAGLLIAGAVVWNSNNPAPAGGNNNQGGGVDVSQVETDGAAFIGNPNAEITIAYWSDYQCPFCKRFELETMPQIAQNYISNGKVRIVFKDFQFLSEDSLTAALYGRAVWELYPEHYAEWRDAIFEAQDQEHGGFGDDASVRALTGTIPGIDGTRVAQAVNDNRDAYTTAINADRAEGQRFGIRSTPSFIIGDQVVVGAQPYPAFEAAIEAVL